MILNVKSQFRKRSAVHIEKDAIRETKLLDSDHFEEKSKPSYCASYLKRLSPIMHVFISFTEDVLNLQSDDPGHGMGYFAEGSELPSSALLKHFMTWYCDSGKGNIVHSSWKPLTLIDNNNMCVSLAKVACSLLVTTFRYWNSTMWTGDRSSSIRRELFLYVETELVNQVALVRSTKGLVTTFQTDVAVLISNIWTFESSASCEDFTTRLYASIVLNLLVDGCGLVGEILSHENKNRFLTWSSLEFILFPQKDPNDIEMAIKVNFKWLKFHKHDTSASKTIGLHLLPPR